MKNRLIIIVIFLIAIVLIFINRRGYNYSKFYLDTEYYNGNTFIKIKASKVEELKNNKSSYIIFTYNNFCKFEVPCEEIFANSMKKNNLTFYSIPYDDFKSTYLSKKVKYAPSVIIVREGKVVAYLDANKNSDIDKYQDVDKFDDWLGKYIYLTSK